MKITALIHTRNEERMIVDCLLSVAWADEVVVADMESEDRTCAISRDAGARVIQVPRVPMVDAIRNLAISQCDGDWVVVVDADERVPSTLAQKLRELSLQAGADAYALPRKNFFLGTWLEFGFWPDYQTRFFKKGAVSWSERVHEAPKVAGKLDRLPADPALALNHVADNNGLGHTIAKLAMYSEMEAVKLRDGSRPPIWPYILRRPLGEFYGRYFQSRAWKLGMNGLVWSLIMTTYQFLIACHYWTLIQQDAANSSVAAHALRRSVKWEVVRTAAKFLLK